MKEVNIDIDAVSCIKCGKCVKVCPSKILSQNNSREAAFVVTTKGCIICGHCVGVCPTGSVKHSEFPEEKVHAIDYNLYPTPEQMMLLMKSRRSNRVFTSQPIPSEKLDFILEAAHRAPTASNMQRVSFTMITDPAKIKLITEFTVGLLSSNVKKLNNPFLKPFLKRIMPDAYRYVPLFSRLQRELENGNDPIIRKATAVMLIHTPKSNRFGYADANLAYQNGSLMAESLGVSQFYMGFVCAAIKQEKKGTLEKMLGIDGTIHSAMALGLPQFRYPNYIDRKDLEVNKL